MHFVHLYQFPDRDVLQSTKRKGENQRKDDNDNVQNAACRIYNIITILLGEAMEHIQFRIVICNFNFV